MVWLSPRRRRDHLIPFRRFAKQGEHIVAQKTIYGGTSNLLAHTLPLYGINSSFVDVHDLAAVEHAIQPNTKAIYIETLGNPNSDIPDIDAIADIAHKYGLPLVIDNTFGTPYLIRPIEHGADIVIHSATKFIGGHGTTLGGIIVDGGSFDWAASGKYPWISAANPSYHGVKFTEAAGKAALLPISAQSCCGTRVPASVPLRLFLLPGYGNPESPAERHVENAKKVVKYLTSIPRWKKSIILLCRNIRITRCTKSIFRTAALPFLHSKSRADGRMPSGLLTI